MKTISRILYAWKAVFRLFALRDGKTISCILYPSKAERRLLESAGYCVSFIKGDEAALDLSLPASSNGMFRMTPNGSKLKNTRRLRRIQE